jgi:hypothetical protein
MEFQISKPPEEKSKMGKPGLWDNIRKRRESGKPMRKKGDPGAPTDKAIKQSQGKMNGGRVKYNTGGCVMAGRGARAPKMG